MLKTKKFIGSLAQFLCELSNYTPKKCGGPESNFFKIAEQLCHTNFTAVVIFVTLLEC